MIVGNGLSINYREWAHPALADLDPSDPLRWQFNVPTEKGIPWQQAFPELAQEIRPYSHLTSFKIFDEMLEKVALQPVNPHSFRHGRLKGSLDWETRQFLSFAFVEFHERYINRPMHGWAWAEWMKRYGISVRAAVSFNYEMLLEIALMHYGRTELWTLADGVVEGGKTLIYKPHGSIDYTTSAITWKEAPLPSKSYIAFCDLPIRLLGPEELRNVRPQPYTILPTESSHYHAYEFFRDSVQNWRSMVAPNLTHLVLVGLSYSKCDRWEIDELMSCVNPNAIFINANPTPDPALRFNIVYSGRKYTEWTSGPQSI